MVEGPWTIAGTIVGVFILIATLTVLAISVYAEFIAPKWRAANRSLALKDPAYVSFLIPSHSERMCNYAIQDESDHLLERLVLKSNGDAKIEIRVAPKLNFSTYAMQFGSRYDGAANIQRKPRAIEFIDPFTELGLDKVCIPGQTRGHKINTHGYYHIDRDIEWNLDTIRVFGFKIMTGFQGTYEWEVVFIGKDFVTEKRLVICVDDAVPMRMWCVSKDHKQHQIKPIFRPTLEGES